MWKCSHYPEQFPVQISGGKLGPQNSLRLEETLVVPYVEIKFTETPTSTHKSVVWL